MKPFVKLQEIADVALGYKSLQNDFFYVNSETIDTFGIEKAFLTPIYVIRNLRSQQFIQESKSTQWIFVCRKSERDLRGTGALRYIQSVAGRQATRKKQSGSHKTVREALAAQGGGIWYAPKATPHRRRIWLRKAFHATYAPFIFKAPVVVDQRCNSLEPRDGMPWELLAAIVTSSLFAYSLEINGSASMGAGALEAPTSKLRTFPVFDPRGLSAKHQKEFASRAWAVWESEMPVDWSNEKDEPGRHLRELDSWLLCHAGSSTSLANLYSDLRASCRARILVASDKVRVQKKHQIESIESVATGVVDLLAPLANSRQFPEGFCDERVDTISINVSLGLLRKISVAPMLDNADLVLTGDKGRVLLSGSYGRSVAEAIVRALLLGRESFVVPASNKKAEAAVSAFLDWFEDIRRRIDDAVGESALGTGYEDTLRAKIYQRIGIHPLAGAKTLPGQIDLSPLML